MTRLLMAALLLLAAAPAAAQDTQGSRNVRLVAHVPLLNQGPVRAVAFDQSGQVAFAAHDAAVSVIDTESGKRTETWVMGTGLVDIAVTPEIIAVSSDSGIWQRRRDTGQVDHLDVGETRSVFAYRHSSGAILLLAGSPGGTLVVGPDGSRTIPIPSDVPNRDDGVHGVYAAYDLGAEQDRLYVAGGGGYFVYDITDLDTPELLTWVNSAAVQVGLGVQATPDATHLVASTGYASAPIRLFDIRPALDGTISQVRTAAGAWTADWRSHAERFEVRWPYVFVAGRDQGFQMFNMRNAFDPYTTAWFKAMNAVDVDVRNRDGLVGVADSATGLWLLDIEDFTGWDGRGWGTGNISSVQDWENGPVYADQW